MTIERTLIRLDDGRWVWIDEEELSTVTEGTATPVPDLLVEMLAALEAANRFITNGLEYGYIDLAEEDTSGMHTIDAIRQAIRKTKGFISAFF